MQGRKPAPIFNQRKRQRQAIFSDIKPYIGDQTIGDDLMPVGGFSASSSTSFGGFSSNKPGQNTGNQNTLRRNVSVTNYNNQGGLNQGSTKVSCDQPNNNNRGSFIQSNVTNRVGYNQPCSSNRPSFNQPCTTNRPSFNQPCRPTTNRPSFNQSANPNQGAFNNQISRTNRGQFNQPNTTIRSSFNNPYSSNKDNTNQSTRNRGGFNQSRTDQSNHGFAGHIGSGYIYQDICDPKEKYKRTGNNEMSPQNSFGDLHENNGTHKVNNYDGRFQKTLNFVQQNEPYTGNAPSKSSGHLFHSAGGVPIASPKGPAPGTQPPQFMFQNNNKSESVNHNFDAKGSFNTIRETHQPMGQFANAATSPTSSKTKQEKDKSTKIITTDIARIRLLTPLEINISGCHTMFEVFGILDSAVLNSQTGSAKEFILKDGSSKLQCLFFEIDRELSRLVRGQWHRCVGTLESRSGKMKCIAIRPAAMEERQTAKLTAAISEKWLKTFSKSANEQ